MSLLIKNEMTLRQLSGCLAQYAEHFPDSKTFFVKLVVVESHEQPQATTEIDESLIIGGAKFIPVIESVCDQPVSEAITLACRGKESDLHYYHKKASHIFVFNSWGLFVYAIKHGTGELLWDGKVYSIKFKADGDAIIHLGDNEQYTSIEQLVKTQS